MHCVSYSDFRMGISRSVLQSKCTTASDGRMPSIAGLHKEILYYKYEHISYIKNAAFWLASSYF